LSTPIAVAAALAGALLLGISSVADQRSTKRVRTRPALSPAILLDLVRQPLWLTAVAANLAGFALQVVALDFGSLVLVQPLLVCDLVFAVLIARYLAWRENARSGGARRRVLPILAGVGAATAGVAGFLAVGQPSGGHSDVSFGVLVPLAIGLVVVVGGCLAAAARNRNLRPLALALACGVNYGVAAFVIKLVTSEFGGGPGRVFTHWPIYVLAVVGPVGYILNQDAFQQGRFLAPVQAIITTLDPVVSIALGVLWLGVRLHNSPPEIFGQVASLLLMITGIVITAHNAPQAAERTATGPTSEEQTPGQNGVRGHDLAGHDRADDPPPGP
jgi:drug/metabolite transporter (DMT)-like permease